VRDGDATDPGSILGLDIGSQRIGVAVAEPGGLTARPLTTLVRRHRAPGAGSVEAGPDAATLAAISRLVAEQRAGEIVVGLALEASGSEGPMAAATRAWAAELHERLGLPVTLRDERLSSHVAESRLGPMPRGRSGGPPSRSQRERYRGRVDREAAAVILQDELDARRSSGR
jgi:putative Holliday junction resolvase